MTGSGTGTLWAGRARILSPMRPLSGPLRQPLRASRAILSVAFAGLAAALAAWVAPARGAELAIEIRGLEDEMRVAAHDALTLSQYLGRPVDEPIVRRLARNADREIQHALEAFGYYSARIAASVEAPAAGQLRAVFDVSLGEPVVVRHARVDVPGEAGDVEAVRTALAAFAPAVGAPFLHRAYEQSKNRIANALRAAGFLDARTAESRVAVSAGDRAADIALAWDPGVRHRFGAVRFSEAQFPESFLRAFVPWKEGEHFSSLSLLNLQQRLIGMDYFATVAVQPDLERAADHTVPVDVLLVPHKRTVYTAGLFVSTDSGLGGRLGVDRRWVNRRGHKASGELAYAQRRQEASFDYRIPRPGVEVRERTLGVAYTNEETESVTSQNLRAAVASTRRSARGFTRTVGLHYLNGDFEIADERRTSGMLYAEASLTGRRVDRERYSARGHSFRLTVRGAPRSAVTDAGFVQGHAAGEWSHGLGDGRIILRGELGAMEVDTFHDLPPELRFFAGGDRSVRGFGYQAIGDTNAAGGVVGGKFLIVGSVEYEHFFLPAWGAAVFVDGGDAFRSEPRANVAAGIGARWKSPIGIVRLDLARPVVTEFGETWRVHLVIGPNL